MKPRTITVLALGWIPTLALLCVPLLAQRHAPVTVTRLYTGADGKTHVEEYEVPLKAQGRGTELSDAVGVKDLQFRRTNQDYNLDWHPAPRRQFVVTLAARARSNSTADARSASARATSCLPKTPPARATSLAPSGVRSGFHCSSRSRIMLSRHGDRAGQRQLRIGN